VAGFARNRVSDRGEFASAGREEEGRVPMEVKS
jgi:hypothetical protein